MKLSPKEFYIGQRISPGVSPRSVPADPCNAEHVKLLLMVYVAVMVILLK